MSICPDLCIQFEILQVIFKTSRNVRFSSTRTVTLIPGDGIGPEISAAVQKIFEVANVSK
jgi:isocitrate dehydrogenase (NAD+)